MLVVLVRCLLIRSRGEWQSPMVKAIAIGNIAQYRLDFAAEEMGSCRSRALGFLTGLPWRCTVGLSGGSSPWSNPV